MNSGLAFDARLSCCPLCGSSEVKPFDRDSKGVTIDRCGACGLMFMNPQYTDAYLDDFYATYFQTYSAGKEQIEEDRLQKEGALDLVSRFKGGGRFLGVGCGDGKELEVARQRGFAVEGYDVDPETTGRVAASLGVPVHSGPFTEIPIPDHSFDCIFLDQVLEHLKDPATYLRHIHRLVKSDGVVYIGVPNLASYSLEWKGWQGRRGLKEKTRGRHYDTSHHLLYFKPGVLKNLLEKHFSFQVLALRGDPRVSISPLRFRLARWNHRLCSRFVVIARPSGRP